MPTSTPCSVAPASSGTTCDANSSGRSRSTEDASKLDCRAAARSQRREGLREVRSTNGLSAELSMHTAPPLQIELQHGVGEHREAPRRALLAGANEAVSAREAEPERRRARLRGGPHASAGLLDEALDDGQPDARPAGATVARALDP